MPRNTGQTLAQAMRQIAEDAWNGMWERIIKTLDEKYPPVFKIWGKWYFWDRSGTNVVGPYPNVKVARQAIHAYHASHA